MRNVITSYSIHYTKLYDQFWINVGVDGFRIDAANHLEKNWDFPDAYPGYENFSSLPKHHDYLQELGKEYFVPNDLLAIGESGGATKEAALKYVGYGSNEFNLLIHFGHTWAVITSYSIHYTKLYDQKMSTLYLTQ